MVSTTSICSSFLDVATFLPIIVISAYISETVSKDLAVVEIHGTGSKTFKKDRIAEEIHRVTNQHLGM